MPAELKSWMKCYEKQQKLKPTLCVARFSYFIFICWICALFLKIYWTKSFFFFSINKHGTCRVRHHTPIRSVCWWLNNWIFDVKNSQNNSFNLRFPLNLNSFNWIFMKLDHRFPPERLQSQSVSMLILNLVTRFFFALHK